ncbi:MAG: type II secretion system F family protein, partial [Planctomycetales bacterium]|nr:type II secretion system F family protein [Planctomycetales bacterium]NIM09856.1 type II secretion system F family protein [Planctomycetales bacterium]NIN09296.1 type II secretion system F family protein [Planctomycetales bacterium]NIN78403.1 type II secretion system F family protein [Planctomycetales bacterium]NIO35581.1 type II secretion system F family protein [Planctomycetales bacterium]
MPLTFLYKARDPLGNVYEGKVDAPSAEEATQQLRRDGYHVLDIAEENADFSFFFSQRVSRSDVIYVTSQLAIMVETGISIAHALATILEQEDNPALRQLLTDLKNSVEAGEDFSTALARHPECFDNTYVSLIRASEATGSLGEMLNRVAQYLEKEREIRGKVRAAMAYPLVMAVTSVGVTIFLLTYIFPKFEPLFKRPGANLPKLTVFLVQISDALLAHWYLWLVAAIATVVALIFFRRTPTGQRTFDYLKINSPVIGPLFRKVAITRSIRTLGTMTTSGVPVLDSLQLSADVAGNYYYQQLWQDVINQVTTGKRICEALAGNPLCPPILVRMIAAGEDAGKLDAVLQKVSGYYDDEVDQAIKTTTRLIEPVMIAVMGVVVGGIAMSLL